MKHYYDPSCHGVDLKSRFQTADAKIQQASSLGQGFGAIAEALDPLNDSHTFFDPPARPFKRDIGYRWAMVGDVCLITAVKPGSDAAGKLAPGDRVLQLERFRVTRKNFWKIGYSINRLHAFPVVTLAIRHADGSEAQVEVAAKMEREKRVLDLTKGDDIWRLIVDSENEDYLARQRWVEIGNAAMVWKMPQFDMSDRAVEDLISKARTKGALILDLRGNPGGYETTLQALVGALMDHEVTIATRQGRKPNLMPVVAKSRGKSAYSGKLAVLIDARSASAAELLARVVQLEKRGVVLGDRSSGHVMESRYYPMSHGAATKTLYGASITEANLVMSDGNSLEDIGVSPDELVLPTEGDVATGRDPVLARAAECLGVQLDPVAAGKLFPTEW